MNKKEMRKIFRECYGEDYLRLKDEQISGFSEIVFTAFCSGLTEGYWKGRIEGINEGRYKDVSK